MIQRSSATINKVFSSGEDGCCLRWTFCKKAGLGSKRWDVPLRRRLIFCIGWDLGDVQEEVFSYFLRVRRSFFVLIGKANLDTFTRTDLADKLRLHLFKK